ncbi:hypothetical protein FN846DRAFT_2794 [Sphaerosporella brunnea]|uniref:GAF domain-containing protein n=1 Tax=Sphaerosporella brunnea TaxID=1250544 RepID=A0A5J5FC77_9PEZI|nr:hypothetical protein FN846DRAFT_2794 [Sphaerosporella brunnea]
MACISLIDENMEVVKAEHSFGRVYLPRSHSIAAHAILGNETMVILDTVKDWRLRGNPLTQDVPNLRFYAGAPIVTFDGHTIGVFAVFDTQPRSSFPAASRRNLMDFARLAMTEFEILMEERDEPKLHMPTKIVGQTKVTEHDDAESFVSRRGRLSQKLLKGIEENAEKMPPVGPFMAGEASEVLLDSPTVPTQPHDSFVARPRTYQEEPVLPPPDTPSTFRHQEPEPPRRPVVVTPIQQPVPPPRTSSRHAPGTSHSTMTTQTIPRYKQNRPLPIFTAPHVQMTHQLTSAPATPATPRIPASPGSITSMVEATYATSLIARSLDYDFVYLLRVTSTAAPDSPLIPIDPYREKIAISTRVLVAHGLPDPPPIFDPSLHLRALRSVGGLIFQNPVREDSDKDDVGYQLGILLPLARDCRDGVGVGGDKAKCIGGIVLAAFARKACAEPAFRADEVRFLREFGEAMRDILVKADRSFKAGVRLN